MTEYEGRRYMQGRNDIPNNQSDIAGSLVFFNKALCRVIRRQGDLQVALYPCSAPDEEIQKQITYPLISKLSRAVCLGSEGEPSTISPPIEGIYKEVYELRHIVEIMQERIEALEQRS